MVNSISCHSLDELFAQIHVTLEVTKCHFRLDHPELRRMARSIGILRAECWTEGVDVRQRASKSFAFKLAAYRQVSGFAEEISGWFLINISLQCCHAEHLPGAFTVAGGDDGRVNINKVALLEELMYRKCQAATHPKNRAKHI